MPQSHQEKQKKKRSVFYRVSAWLHLWLGLVSGIVVVVISLTAAAIVFEEEIRNVFEPWQTVNPSEDKALLPPSVLRKAVMETYGFPSVYGVYYRGADKSAMIPYYGDRKNYQQAFVNPYTGEVLHNHFLNGDFFRFMLIGHYQLWLPRSIGKPIVAYSTLIFVIALITGLVLWWPKKWTRTTRNASLKIKWKASFKRVNYDLHNVFGFYALLIALVLALTGMVYGMQWFSDIVYWTSSGGELRQRDRPVSDTTLVMIPGQIDEDILFDQLQQSGVDIKNNVVQILYPLRKTDVWNVGVNPSLMNSFRNKRVYYEQNSLKILKAESTFSEANGGEQIMRLNYDLHVGAIGGIWTKIIAFLVCLISASLPITGLIVWLGKEKKKHKKNKKEGRRKLVVRDFQDLKPIYKEKYVLNLNNVKNEK